jgi:hypothetical protein
MPQGLKLEFILGELKGTISIVPFPSLLETGVFPDPPEGAFFLRGFYEAACRRLHWLQ